ncbi:MAG: hypothetical protein VX633_01075 [Verrucomicrobiota bacterium]|nr:hypothetical protein [Verrucomicrobiota bacterium]
MMESLLQDDSTPALINISPRTILRLSGPDRLRFLNGQVSQDVALANNEEAVYSCLLNPKGQLDAICHIREHGDSYLIDAPLELRNDLQVRLERYMIADDVELRDESDEWSVSHLINHVPPPNDHALCWTTKRLASPGFDLFSRSRPSVKGVEDAPLELYEMMRTLHGIPAWGAELAAGLLPPDANLERDTVSYDKGCYIGQEVISRMKRAGKTNRHLVKFIVPSSTIPPCPIYHESSEAGEITTVTRNPSERNPLSCGLGFRRRRFSEIEVFDLQSEQGATLPGAVRIRP